MATLFGIYVPLPQSFVDRIVNAVLSFFDPILKPIKGAINIFFNLREVTTGTIDEVNGTVQDAIGAYAAIKEFSVNFDKDAKHRVVETVRAYQQLRRMAIDIPVEIWKKVNDLVKLATTWQKGVEIQAKEAIADIEEVEGVAELKTFITKLGPKLGRIFAKLLEIIGILQTMLQGFHDVFVDIHSIVRDLREEIEKVNRLNFIFLPQDNKRERVKLEDGSEIYRRNPALGKVKKRS